MIVINNKNTFMNMRPWSCLLIVTVWPILAQWNIKLNHIHKFIPSIDGLRKTYFLTFLFEYPELLSFDSKSSQIRGGATICKSFRTKHDRRK